MPGRPTSRNLLTAVIVAAVACVLVGSTGVPAPSVAALRSDAAQDKTFLLCANGDGDQYRRKAEPKQCVIFGPGGIFGGGVNLNSLDWKGWGDSTTTATGIECGFHLPCADINVRVKASRPRIRCGVRVYTRLKATSQHGSSTPSPSGCEGPTF